MGYNVDLLAHTSSQEATRRLVIRGKEYDILGRTWYRKINVLISRDTRVFKAKQGKQVVCMKFSWIPVERPLEKDFMLSLRDTSGVIQIIDHFEFETVGPPESQRQWHALVTPWIPMNFEAATKQLYKDKDITLIKNNWLQAFDGLTAIFAIGVLHKDISSENVRVEVLPSGEYRTIITDFDMAQDFDFASGTSAETSSKRTGTIAYMAYYLCSTKPDLFHYPVYDAEPVVWLGILGILSAMADDLDNITLSDNTSEFVSTMLRNPVELSVAYSQKRSLVNALELINVRGLQMAYTLNGKTQLDQEHLAFYSRLDLLLTSASKVITCMQDHQYQAAYQGYSKRSSRDCCKNFREQLS